MLVFVSLIALQLGEAIVPGPPPAVPAPAPISCDTPLCQGLVAGGAAAVGFGAIAGIVGAVAEKPKEDRHPHPPHPAAHPPTHAPADSGHAATHGATHMPTHSPELPETTAGIFAREDAKDEPAERGSSPLLPLIIALLLLCCILGIVAYFCTKPKKRATKLSKKKVTTVTPAE